MNSGSSVRLRLKGPLLRGVKRFKFHDGRTHHTLIALYAWSEYGKGRQPVRLVVSQRLGTLSLRLAAVCQQAYSFAECSGPRQRA